MNIEQVMTTLYYLFVLGLGLRFGIARFRHYAEGDRGSYNLGFLLADLVAIATVTLILAFVIVDVRSGI